MSKAILAVLAIVCASGLYSAANPEPACAACTTFPCSVSSQCNAGCSCMKKGSDSFGSCVSFN